MAGMKIKKGDTVQVLTGRDQGKRGEIIKAMPRDGKVVVQGVNLAKRHQRPTPQSQGGIEEKELPLDASNVAMVDPKTDKPTRVGYKTLDDGRKVRVAKASGEVIDS